ncbi:MAG: Hsp20/alpha crystallin family protein [Chloroflexota bacterium]
MSRTVIRYEPFREMLSPWGAMTSLFDDRVTRGARLLGSGVPAFPVDVYQTAEELVVQVAVPGLKPDDLQVQVLRGLLTVRGASHRPESQGGEYLRQELTYGAFERTLALPFAVQAEEAVARFENGLLTIRLPRAEEARPRQIAIQVQPAQVESEKPADLPTAA